MYHVKAAPPLPYCLTTAYLLSLTPRLLSPQTEICKRLNAILAQVIPFLSQDHQQQVASAVERAKQVTMAELNQIIGVSDGVYVFMCFTLFPCLTELKVPSPNLKLTPLSWNPFPLALLSTS